MDDIRCGSCGRKLGEGIYTHLSIKCPRCGVLNNLRAVSPTSERPGVPFVENNNGKPYRALDRRQTPPGRPSS
ncbi:Com family DNA-binding transcriptional regulator [Comamonas odontotermitis]|uniref:Com family DNA-binding transcriptional regulator n=1 Tax=Comamonas odontotermitis TaxID=379895 RepID=UPI0037523B00